MPSRHRRLKNKGFVEALIKFDGRIRLTTFTNVNTHGCEPSDKRYVINYFSHIETAPGLSQIYRA
jgi:hypothetical protein